MSAPFSNNNMNAQEQRPAPSFLQKKGLLGGAKGMGSIVSPTDNVLSPCSAKLSGAKQRHFQKGIKPMGISSQLSQFAVPPSATANSEQQSDKPKIDF